MEGSLTPTIRFIIYQKDSFTENIQKFDHFLMAQAVVYSVADGANFVYKMTVLIKISSGFRKRE